MFTLRVGVSAWYTVNTLVIYLWVCTRGGCSCIFHGLVSSLGRCVPIHYVCVCLYTMFVCAYTLCLCEPVHYVCVSLYTMFV